MPLAQLYIGESEAIALAAEARAGVLLIDEQAGRREALRRGLKVAGTLSVLDEADRTGLVTWVDAISALRNTSFRLSELVLAEIEQKRAR